MAYTNEDRAAYAETALEAYVDAKTSGTLGDYPYERVDYARDLLIDLLHFIEDEGGLIDTSVEAILTATQVNYQTEVDEQAPDED
jgi:hypothetical protein